MPGWIRNYIKVVIAACLIVSFCVAEGDAQTRRKKKRRRSVPAAPKPVITNPAIAPPDTGDVKIISTADSNKEASKESSDQNPGSKPKSADPNDQEKTQQTISDLSKQVDRLNNKLSSMQEDDRYQMDMERLTRAEQRAEQLRSQLMDIQAKIADFEARIEQLDWALRPENLDNSTAGYGSTHPETLREAQLKLAESSKSRLETAVSNADSEVDLLRAKLEQRRAQMDATPAETPAKPETKPRKPEN